MQRNKIRQKHFVGIIALVCFVVIIQQSAIAQTGLSSAEPVSRPVITVDAGVLPTSRFYFLDKFDEWVQKNIFTFSINSFRAQVYLESAAERISELQFLNAQGMLTNEIAGKSLDSWQKDLSFSASLVGNEFLRGRRPISLTDGVVRTLLASVDAIQAEFNENSFIGEESLNLPDNFLATAEKKIIASLLPENAGIPDSVLRLVSDDMAVEVQQELARLKALLASEKETGFVRAGQTLLINAVEENQKIAKTYYDQSDYGNSLESYNDCRLALRLATNNNLVLDPGSFTDKNEFVEQVDRIMALLIDSGLLDVGDLVLERVKIIEEYSE